MHLINTSQWQHQQTPTGPRYFIGTPHISQNAFAFIKWNDTEKKLTAYRDHFGLEPFYYYFQNNHFIFGSNLPDIIKQLPSHPDLNTQKIITDCFPENSFFHIPYSNETYYKNIYRAEPGHCLTIQNNKISSKPFWTLNSQAPEINYSDECDYLDHFTFLLHAAVKSKTNNTKLAAELSGGIDSCAVVTACHQLNIKPGLFCHIAPENSEETDDRVYAECLRQHLNLDPIHCVDATGFDPIAVFDEYANYFAGGAPFIFFMMANNVHKAVIKNGYTTLLSGFGGDECVSSHAPRHAFYPALFRSKNNHQAFYEMQCQLKNSSNVTPHKLKVFKALLRYRNPLLYQLMNSASDMKRVLKSYLALQSPQPRTNRDPKLLHSVRHFEHDQLQGASSHHIRMRIEYSAVAAKALGFSYAYPLLDPALVEFCFQLPLKQKRQHGITRYLIRRYLGQYVPEKVYQHNNKKGGILPATMHLSKKYFREGQFDAQFNDLPFQSHIHPKADLQRQLIAKINGYMFKTQIMPSFPCV